MFRIQHKKTKERFLVYAVKVDVLERTKFLIYNGLEWTWIFADEFRSLGPC